MAKQPQPQLPGRKPTHRICRVVGDGEHASWTPIGATWPNKDGMGFSLTCDAVPPQGRIPMRARPKTQAHLDQKLKSLSGFDRYWLEVLSTGSFGRTVLVEPAEPWAQGCFIATEALMDGWRAYETGQRQFQPRQDRQIAQHLASLCPSAKANRTTLAGRQRRGFCLPPLEQAREEFEAYVWGKPEWPA